FSFSSTVFLPKMPSGISAQAVLDGSLDQFIEASLKAGL
ncbi:hypothetical protein O5202_26115, partial [Escherichia coli]|nr:hypothetical protein [Escherichia coli]